MRKIWARIVGLTARIDRGKVYFSSKALHRGFKADFRAGLFNIVIRDNTRIIVCPSGDKRIRRYKHIWRIEDA